jgi:transglutaminase-like putative cysteine protease
MSWRLKVVHKTKFEYESEVLASFNETRMTPTTSDNQTLIGNNLKTNPEAVIFSYEDYFGTIVKSFDIQHPHASLEIISESTIETNIPDEGSSFISWNEIESSDISDKFSEFLVYTELVDPITPSFNLRELQSPVAAIHFLNEHLRQQIKYIPGVTNVKTPASQAWDLKLGVCQDFTHAALSLLRAVKIPARYVSGYLYHGDGNIGEVVTGESHSWCEAWVGFWLAFDPTNGNQVLEDHILVARGRDYHDVSPIRGIFSGGRGREVDVEVKITRLA